jgi:asparagine synthase (glutamine-hydrolysing)
MCGILGLVGSEAAADETASRIATGLKMLHGRGPNGSKTEHGSDWVLGHTRLKILDLTERAAQPMRDEYGRWLVFNGEIYNFRELRRELEAVGHRFRSTGDTEVLLRALAQWGTNALERLNGMFAFGWLDPNRRELILARDRFGVKPLVWEMEGDSVRFASDLFALDSLSQDERQIDVAAARQYLVLGYVAAPRCIWRGPRKVMPGTFVRIRWRPGSKVECHESTFWSFGCVASAGLDEQLDTDAEFANKVSAAVRSRLISDVSVGLLLSGGIDSSTVAVACADLPKTEADVPSFTMGFTEEYWDERPYARDVARTLGLKHQDFAADSDDVASQFENLWNVYDEPFADSSALPMVALCREIARRVTVAIGGDGGDEVWCGYPWHRALFRKESTSPAIRHVLARLGRFGGPRRRYQSAVLSATDRLETWSVLKTGLTASTIRFLPIEGEPIPPSEYFSSANRQISDIRDPLDWSSRMDLMTYLPDDLMVKADRASMHFGLELREPLLDYRLVEWGLCLPTRQRFDFKKRQGKQPARRLLERRLSAGVLDRRKQGFSPPLCKWLNGPLREHCREATRRLLQGDLAPLRLPPECSDWDGCANRLSDDHSQFLWRIVCFFGWLKARKNIARRRNQHSLCEAPN